MGDHPAGGPGQAAHSGHRHPCRHGPPRSRPIVGQVIGFAFGWEGQAHGKQWITADTVRHDGLRQVADRLRVDTALLHLGCVRFPVTGPVRSSMTAREAVQLCRLVRPRTAIEQELEQAPADIRGSTRWLPLGQATILAA
jgi:hypothetical protein